MADKIYELTKEKGFDVNEDKIKKVFDIYSRDTELKEKLKIQITGRLTDAFKLQKGMEIADTIRLQNIEFPIEEMSEQMKVINKSTELTEIDIKPCIFTFLGFLSILMIGAVKFMDESLQKQYPEFGQNLTQAECSKALAAMAKLAEKVKKDYGDNFTFSNMSMTTKPLPGTDVVVTVRDIIEFRYDGDIVEIPEDFDAASMTGYLMASNISKFCKSGGFVRWGNKIQTFENMIEIVGNETYAPQLLQLYKIQFDAHNKLTTATENTHQILDDFLAKADTFVDKIASSSPEEMKKITQFYHTDGFTSTNLEKITLPSTNYVVGWTVVKTTWTLFQGISFFLGLPIIYQFCILLALYKFGGLILSNIENLTIKILRNFVKKTLKMVFNSIFTLRKMFGIKTKDGQLQIEGGGGQYIYIDLGNSPLVIWFILNHPELKGIYEKMPDTDKGAFIAGFKTNRPLLRSFLHDTVSLFRMTRRVVGMKKGGKSRRTYKKQKGKKQV